jgi:hypothetical protein
MLGRLAESRPSILRVNAARGLEETYAKLVKVLDPAEA